MPVDGWVRRHGPRPNLVVNDTAPNGRRLGRSLTRDARAAVTAARALGGAWRPHSRTTLDELFSTLD
jgi:hypothetical protein